MLTVARRQLFTSTLRRAELAAERSRANKDFPAQGLPLVVAVEQLDGGLHAATIDTKMPMASLALLVPAGARAESIDNQGVAHFLKNFAFKTTANQTPVKLVRETELRGAMVATQLGREHLMYKADFLRDDLPYIIEMFADVAQNTKYTHWEHNNVASTVAEEAASAYCTSSIVAYETAHRLAFRTGLGNSVFAPPTSKVDVDAIKSFATQNVQFGSKSAIVGVGVDQEDLTVALKSYVGLVSSKNKDSTQQPAKYYGGEQRIDCIEKNTIVVAFQGAARPSKEHGPLAVLGTLLGSSPQVKWGNGASPLSKIAESTNAQVSAFNVTYSDAGLFGLTVESSDPRAVTNAIQQAVAALKDVTTGVEQTVLDRAINQAKATLFANMEPRSSLAEITAVQLATTGKLMPAAELASIIGKVTVEDVIKVAKRLISSKPSIAVVGELHRLPYTDTIGF